MSEGQDTASPADNGPSVLLDRRAASFLGLDPGPKRAGPDFAMPPPEPATIPRVATFFALYPQPLGLADGATFCIAIATPIDGFRKTAMHIKEGQTPFWLHPTLSESIAISIRFHRGKLKRDIVDEHDERLLSVVHAVQGDSFPDFGEGKAAPSSRDEDVDTVDDGPTGTIYTVVEMSTQLVMPAKSAWVACEPAEAIMGPTLTRCINGLMQVIDAYRFGEKILIASPARERLGPAIVAATRAADPSQGGWDAPARYVINYFAAYGGNGFVRGTHSPETFGNMSTYLKLVAARNPIPAIGSMQNDMQHAMFIDGNFRAVIVFAHSASEILMDAALMAMMFEENKSPQDAAMTLARPLKTRILSDYHDRLGGAWDPQGSPAVATWVRDVLLIRHQVVHAGYLPFYEEAQAAHDAHFGLGTYLRDRLASRAKRYPFTAGLLVTTGGFERRGIRTKASDTAVRTSSERLQEFTEWRDNVVRQRE